MNKLLSASDALAITEMATLAQIEKDKIDTENKWRLNLKLVNDKLNDNFVTINSMIGSSAERTNYELSFVLSINDLKYADGFNFYNHLIFPDFNYEQLQMFVDVFSNTLKENGYSIKTACKSYIGLSPQLKTSSNEDYYILEVSWAN